MKEVTKETKEAKKEVKEKKSKKNNNNKIKKEMLIGIIVGVVLVVVLVLVFALGGDDKKDNNDKNNDKEQSENNGGPGDVHVDYGVSDEETIIKVYGMSKEDAINLVKQEFLSDNFEFSVDISQDVTYIVNVKNTATNKIIKYEVNPVTKEYYEI